MPIINLPSMYVPFFSKGKPIVNGKIYIGLPGKDPITNPKKANLIQEDGSKVVAMQPIRTNGGGIAQLNGSPVVIDVDGEYSIRIDDKDNTQIYFFTKLGSSEENVTLRLIASALDLGFPSSAIGKTLVTGTVGQPLKGVEYILELDNNIVYEIPYGVPEGASVVSLVNGFLVNTVDSLQLKPKQADITQTVTNLLKGNQNLNVPGADGTITTSPQTFTSGKEFSLGWKVKTGSTVSNIVRNVGETTASSGIMEFTYKQDVAEQIDDNNSHFSVTNKAGLQTYAKGLDKNGLAIDSHSTTNEVKLSVDFSVYRDGIAYVTLNNKFGQAQPVNDIQSEAAIFNFKDFNFLDNNNYSMVADVKPTGTPGGSSSLGENIRDLTTVLYDSIGITLTNNKVTLKPGVYYIIASAPSFRCTGSQIYITNQSGTVLLTGTSSYSSNVASYAVVESTLRGTITLANQTDINISQKINTPVSGNGLGLPVSPTKGQGEIYSTLNIWKVR